MASGLLNQFVLETLNPRIFLGCGCGELRVGLRKLLLGCVGADFLSFLTMATKAGQFL